jgi:hypothetical protein
MRHGSGSISAGEHAIECTRRNKNAPAYANCRYIAPFGGLICSIPAESKAAAGFLYIASFAGGFLW